jgi:hypothetical protein
LGYKDKNEFSKKITLGFKLISGIYCGGISKDEIDSLSENTSINWESDIDLLLGDFNTIFRILESDSFFKYFKSWRKSIMEVTSDAIAINFMVIVYLDWKRKDKPVGSSTKSNQFLKNAKILVDKLLFEYLTRQWRGSSDSKIAENIRNAIALPDVYQPIERSKWLTLINEVFNNHKINESALSRDGIDSLLKPLLYYYYVLKSQGGPSEADALIDVDHIMPKSILESSALPEIDMKKHNLANLILLPKRLNISKGDKRLNEIHDQWLKDQIVRFAEIPEADFNRFSNVSNFDDLSAIRKNKFDEAFSTRRDRIFNN